jgi:hypothetical protein
MVRSAVLRQGEETQVGRAQPAPLARRADFGTILFGHWLMLGLAIDGWAHHTRPNVESFFTPWHALLYSGYAACAAWMLWLIAEQRRAGRIGRAAIPRGYELGLAGVVLFGLAGIGDLIWHETIGIEQNRKASLSPSHLLLFVGIVLIVSSPFRAAWATDDAPHARPRLIAFLPALLSLSGAAAITGAMHIWLWGFAYLADGRPALAALPAAALAPTADLNLAMILVTTVLLMAPLLLLLLRWRPPFGSAVVLFGIVAGLLCAVTGFRQPVDVLVAVATGLCADLAVRGVDPRPGRPWAFRGVAFGVPLLLWALHFAQVGVREGIGWPPEYWTGIMLLAGLLGLGLSVLLLPPIVPAHAREH